MGRDTAGLPLTRLRCAAATSPPRGEVNLCPVVQLLRSCLHESQRIEQQLFISIIFQHEARTHWVQIRAKD